MTSGDLGGAIACGALRSIDVQFAHQVCEIGGTDDPCVLLAAALTSHRAGQGDVCLPLPDYAGHAIMGEGPHADTVQAPPLDEWLAALRTASVVGSPGVRAPLVLDDAGRLYLARFWHLEDSLAAALRRRIGHWLGDVDRTRLREGLDRLFPPTATGGEVDWQRVAAALAVLRPVCVISGGPGTGKTRTVASVLALLLEQAAETPLRIGLAAPTGKAAARLSESIAEQKAGLDVDPAIRELIPDEALTLHRLLGYRPGRSLPSRGRNNPLHVDVLVVDEASMVDLALMSRTLEALPPTARLILLGDRNQLSSVAAGMVLGDICGRGSSLGYSAEKLSALADVGCTIPAGHASQHDPALRGGLADHIVELRKSWRFDDASGIGAVASAVNAGDASRTLDLLGNSAFPDVERLSRSTESLRQIVLDELAPIFREAVAAKNATQALEALDRFRILSAVREGPFGVIRLNELVGATLESAGVIRREGVFYAGLPIMITTNDHAQRLYNGDVGIILPDPDADGAFRFWLQTPDGVRRVLPSRLPAHETVFAMTIHKSQGSEFDTVLLVMPGNDSPMLTRELLYTGITRARARVSMMADPSEISAACSRRVDRATGLFDLLWKESEG